MIALLDNGTHKIQTAGRLPNDSELAIQWRDAELKGTDWIVPITDHPQHSSYIPYRQALRDWPSSVDFPTIRPIL